ncbi:MAG: hypothetical protein AAF363_15075 [Bacteroidota bacterium]
MRYLIIVLSFFIIDLSFAQEQVLINQVELEDNYYLCISCGNKLFYTKEIHTEEDGSLTLHSHFDKSHVYIDEEGDELFCGACKHSIGKFNKKKLDNHDFFVRLENQLVELDQETGNVVCNGCGGLLSEDHEHLVQNSDNLNLDLAFKDRLPSGFKKGELPQENKPLIQCSACSKYIGYEDFDDQNWSFNYQVGLDKIRLFKKK